jgi:hypothetical protein
MADSDDASSAGRTGRPARRRRSGRLRRAGMFDAFPHIVPEGDQFQHVATPGCPCRPLLDTGPGSSPGAAASYRHRLIQPEPLPDVFPAEWLAS